MTLPEYKNTQAIDMQSLAMTFLTPATGLTAGLLAGTALLIFYFLRLRRRPVRVSTTAFWETRTADLQVNVPFRFLRPSWLLLLQLGALALLAAALARPAIPGSGSNAATTIILIDHSASMSALDIIEQPGRKPRSRLDVAKQRARLAVRSLPTGARAMIVSFGSRAIGLTRLTSDRALLNATIDSIQPTDEPGDLAPAFDLVRAVAGQSPDEAAAPPRAIVFSDGDFDPTRDVRGPGSVNIEFVRVAPEDPQPRNIGIVALAARRDYDDPATVRLFVRLQNASTTDAVVPLTCTLDDALISRTTLAVPAAQTPDQTGEASRTITFQNAQGGLAAVSIAHEDELPSDNAASLTIQRSASLRIIIVRPSASADALDEIVESAFLAIDPDALETITASEFEQRLADRSLEADLVVFDRVRPTALPAAPSISFGAALPIPGLALTSPSEPPREPARVLFWQRAHPILRYVALGDLLIAAPARLLLPADSVSTELRATALASGNDGPLIALLESASSRRVIVAFDLAESTWLKDAGFHIFLKNAVDHLTLSGESESGRPLRTADVFSVRPAPDANELTIRGPRELTRALSENERQRVTLGPLPLVGVYRIEGAIAQDAIVPINLLDPWESRVASAETLSSRGVPLAQASTSTSDREIWPWFVIAAVALLAIEWAVFSWRMRV